MKSNRVNRTLSIMLCMTLVFSGLTTPAKNVQAEETQATATTKTIAGLGTNMIVAPIVPASDSDAWTGSYVYFGNYDADGDTTAEPVKYRVLDASTTDYSADGTTQTMLLDCDSVLHKQIYDSSSREWASSDIYETLNGDSEGNGGFINTAFTTAEKNAIAASTKTAANALDGTEVNVYKYAPLAGEKIFILDAKEATRTTYGYSNTGSKATNRVKKLNGEWSGWWTRSGYGSLADYAGYVIDVGEMGYMNRLSNYLGVSPALNLNLSSVLFASVVTGVAGATGAEYKLTLLDSDMTIAPESGVTKNGDTVTIPYSIGGTNSGNASQVSVLILDKEYTVGNTNGASILAYDKLNVESFSASGKGTYTIPNLLSGKKAGIDYRVYIVAEDVNGDKETDYASAPVEVYLWEVPTVKQMNFGTQGIIDPAMPNSINDAWKGCYVYYGNYSDSPVKYRVLDASTTDYSADKTTQTMLLDCDSVLYRTPFDEDGAANEEGKYANDWSVSDVKNSLNGAGGFIDTAFTTTEKSAITASVKAAASTLDGAGRDGLSYASLTGERIFLLDAKEATRIIYGYSGYKDAANREKKLGNTKVYCWLRSAHNNQVGNAGYVWSGGFISNEKVSYSTVGVSPALNLNLSSVLFSSVSTVSKSSALTSESTKIGTTTNTDWKLTLKDSGKVVALIEGRSVTKASNGTITVPYTYADGAATESEKVNQISVMITDKTYGSESAQILYYGALDNVKNTEGTDSTVAEATTGTGTFALPSGLTGTWGTNYHIYLLAEHVNADNSTDYASEPLEIEAETPIAIVKIPNIDAPIAELPLETELEVSEEGVSAKASVTWKRGETKAIGNAELNATYQAFVKLTAKDGYTFINASGAIAAVTLNGKSVDSKNVTLNDDGTLTVACGEYKAIARKITEVAAPTVPTQFASYYTAENVLASTELGATVKVTLQGSTQPNSKDMKVEWTLADENGGAYDATPSATNTFKWTVTSSEYETYDVNGKVMEGTVTIQNKASTPVTVGGSQVSVNDDGTVTYVAPTNKSVTTVTIPDIVTIDGVTYKVTAIAKNAFKNNKYIKKVTIGSNIETIGANAFYGCKKLKTVKLGKNVITIGDKAFYKCTALTKITIPSKVKTIGKQAFYGCKQLKSVTIGKSVTKIGSKAFYGCSKLKTLTIKSKKLTTKKIGSKAFGKTPKSMKVKIPKKKFKAYKSMLIKRGVNKKARFKKI